jgi:hypothetical protein
MRATCPTSPIRLDLMTQIIFGEEYRPLSSPLCSLHHSPVTSSLFGPHIFLNTLFSATLSPYSSHKKKKYWGRYLDQRHSRIQKHSNVYNDRPHMLCYNGNITQNDHMGGVHSTCAE